jgi:hypothetical protein
MRLTSVSKPPLAVAWVQRHMQQVGRLSAGTQLPTRAWVGVDVVDWGGCAGEGEQRSACTEAFWNPGLLSRCMLHVHGCHRQAKGGRPTL